MIPDNYAAGDKTRAQQSDGFKSNSSGMVLVVVVILAAVAGILAAGLHFASGSRITQVRQEMRFEKAFFVAEAGIERAKDELRYHPTNLNTVLFGGVTNYGEGTFHVSARTNGGANNIVIIRSTGVVETATRVIEVEVQMTPFTPGQVQADGAMGIYGTNTELTVSGNSEIDGNDWNLPSTIGNNDETLSGNLTNPGVFYTSTTTVFDIQKTNSLIGNPGLTNGVGTNNETLLYQFLASIIPYASTNLANLGTRSDPRITICPTGATMFAGNTVGAGILIIPGKASLKISGTFDYEGLVILEGDGVIDDDLTQIGTARIFGAMICVGGALEINFKGTADLKYSTQALANLANIKNLQEVPAQLDMISWKEIKPVP